MIKLKVYLLIIKILKSKEWRVFVKSIKKMALLTIIVAGIHAASIYPDENIQKRIRLVVQKHQNKAQVIKTKDELQKFLTTLKNELKEILKDAPNTTQYKELKKAIENLNPKEMATNFDHIKTILKNVDKDIKESILNFIPFQFKTFFMV